MVVVYKPAFVRHDGDAAIFSVDCHPDGTRLATAGGDQKVSVWALGAVIDTTIEANPNLQKKLATLSDHFNVVNCVRFSKNGRWLASGSTDTNIFLYELRAGPGRAAFGSSDDPNVENWVNCQALRGHASDVIDLAWAPDDTMVASCSLDNLVIVWDPVTGQRLHTLRGHTSFVKGVSWDPIGKYLASQSDDKSCIVWRVDDWSVVTKITEPYKASMGATFSLRLCWSPDGSGLTSCNSYKKPTHTANVMQRGLWDSTYNFVGHKAPVVAVRFSPELFRPQGDDDTPYTVIACGSQDCKLTVWATTSAKPLLIVKDSFTQSVVDLCWSPNGYNLIACSMDGTVMVFNFEEAELGVQLSEEAKHVYLSEKYGDLRRRVEPILEDPSLLGREQQGGKHETRPEQQKELGDAPVANSQQQQQQQQQQGCAAPMGAAGVSERVAGERVAAGVGRNAGGGERAEAAGGEAAPKVPKRIAPQAVGVGSETAAAASATVGMAAAAATAVTIRDTSGAVGAAVGSAPGPGPGSAPHSVPGLPSVAPTANLQQETRGNDGRRRIMPVQQGGGGGRMYPPGVPQHRFAPNSVGPGPSGAGSAVKRRIEPTSMGICTGAGIDGPDPKRMMLMSSPGKHSSGAGDSRGGGGGYSGGGGSGRGHGGGSTTVIHMALAPHLAGAAMLPMLPTPPTLHYQLDGGQADPFAAAAALARCDDGASPPALGPTMLEVENGERHAYIKCTTAGTEHWTDRCSDSCATHLAGSSKFAAVFYENSTVQLYTPAGRRAMPPLVLPGRAAFISAAGGQLIVVTGDGSLVVWEVGTPGEATLVMRESVAPLLTGPRAPPAPPMIAVRLAVCGSPVAQFADGHAFVFHRGLKSWARVADHSFPRSEFTSSLDFFVAAGGPGGGSELHALQAAARRANVGMGTSALLRGSSVATRGDTGRHLECLMASADMLGSQVEYRTHLRAYVKHLADGRRTADEGAQAPLRELCMSLLGPLSGGGSGGGGHDCDSEAASGATTIGRGHGHAAAGTRSSGAGWVREVAGGLSKRALLREVVLPVLAVNRACQRLTSEMHDLLEVARGRSGE